MKKKIALHKVTIKLTYNGFHGLNRFNLRVPQPEKFNGGDPYGGSNTYILDLSASQIDRINKVVGCRTHRMIFGNRQKIEGACGCGEGIHVDRCIYAIKDGDNAYLINGRYPQN